MNWYNLSVNKEDLIKFYTLRGSNVYPQPILEKDVRKIVKKFLKGDFETLSLDQVWANQIEIHQKYWSMRFGVNLGYKLIDNPDRISGYWDKYNMYTKIGGHSEVKTSFMSHLTYKKVEKKLQSFCLTYLARYSEEGIDKNSKTFSFKDYPTPSWDWDLWREKALMITEPISAIDHYLIDTLIRRFKTKKIEGNPDEHLQEIIRLSYQG